ncbi:MAG TPA: hypothetical protein VHF22_05000, partial [Planctomycetota bacterium]|nr:hypothetical protein [Planctomycetota bacterium]
GVAGVQRGQDLVQSLRFKTRRTSLMLLKKKLAIAAGALALVLGSAIGFKAVTGQCPLAALCHAIHGQPSVDAAQVN